MKNIVLLIALTLLPAEVYAHADHAPKVATCADKECSKAEIDAAVPAAVKRLISSGKADAAWANAQVEKVELKKFKKEDEWVATLFDQMAKEPTKQRLYVYITKKGVLNGSNFDGK